MAGDIGDLVLQRKAARFHGAKCRKRHGHQRRLRVGGQRQRLFGAFPHDRGQLLAERVIDFLKHRAGLGKGICEVFAHADSLAALPRKGECDGHDRLPELFHSKAVWRKQGRKVKAARPRRSADCRA